MFLHFPAMLFIHLLCFQLVLWWKMLNNLTIFFCFSKDDESLRKWKEQLLGDIDVSAVGGTCLSYFPSILFFFWNNSIYDYLRDDVTLTVNLYWKLLLKIVLFLQFNFFVHRKQCSPVFHFQDNPFILTHSWITLLWRWQILLKNLGPP